MKKITFPASPPQCKKKTKCRLHYGAAMTTCMGWTPIYDGHGNLVNSNPNTLTQAVECDACSGAWVEQQTSGIKKWTPIPGGK